MKRIYCYVVWNVVVWKSSDSQMVDGDLVERGIRNQLQLLPDG